MKKTIYIILILFNYCLLTLSYGEGDLNDFPSWEEREGLNLINAVRLDPIGYRNYFMSNSTFTNLNNIFVIFPSTEPLYYSRALNNLAYSHSKDMVINRCFSHNSCDGENIWTRFSRFDQECNSNGKGENIAFGARGISILNTLLCGSTSNCESDGGFTTGQRQNILNSAYNFGGIGYYYDYFTQDFVRGSCSYETNQIYSGSHSFYPDLIFMASYYNKDNSSLLSAKVYHFSIQTGNITVNNLELLLGTNNKGVYSFAPLNYSNCDSYYYEFTTNNNTFRYPTSGYLNIVNGKSCNAWVPVLPMDTPLPSQTPSPTSTPPSSSSDYPTNTPQKCLGEPACGGPSRGTCSTYGCICIHPWTGFDCSSQIIEVPQPTPEPENPSTTISYFKCEFNQSNTIYVNSSDVITCVGNGPTFCNDYDDSTCETDDLYTEIKCSTYSKSIRCSGNRITCSSSYYSCSINKSVSNNLHVNGVLHSSDSFSSN